MVIQDELVTRVEEFLDKLRKEPQNKHLTFSCHKSKSTNSLYVDVISFIDGHRLKFSYRFSDHYNSKVKTKIMVKHTKFGFIERKVYTMIKQMKAARYKKWCQLESRKRK
mgnify:CR=1 FL=1